MKNVLISTDEYCYLYNGNFYLKEFDMALVMRYAKVYGVISAAFRVKEVHSIQELGHYNNKVDLSTIHIIAFPFFQGPVQYIKRWLGVQSVAKKSVAKCDFAIVRLPSTIGFAIVKYLLAMNKPYATEIVYDCFDGYLSSNNFINRILWKRLHLKQVEACKKSIGVACVTAEYLQKRYYPTKQEAVTANYSSIELPIEYFYKPRPFPEHKRINIVHVANQVTFAGRKGHNELILTLADVVKQGYDISVTFVGGDYNNGIEKLTELAHDEGVSDRIEFTGYVTSEKLRNILIDSDIAVLPTKAEGLPRVVIEALAVGLPCITTPVSGNGELVKPEFLIPYSDITGFSKSIIKLISNPSLYEKTSLENYERAKEYSTEVLNKQRSAFFKKVEQLANNKFKL